MTRKFQRVSRYVICIICVTRKNKWIGRKTLPKAMINNYGDDEDENVNVLDGLPRRWLPSFILRLGGPLSSQLNCLPLVLSLAGDSWGGGRSNV